MFSHNIDKYEVQSHVLVNDVLGIAHRETLYCSFDRDSDVSKWPNGAPVLPELCIC